MLGRYLKGKIGRKEKESSPSDQFYTPLRIGLHSTITINTIDLLTIDGKHEGVKLPQSELTVNGIGETKTTDGEIFHIYVEDDDEQEFILQLSVDNETVYDIMLFQEMVTITPTSSASWDAHMSQIGFLTLDLNDVIYDRVWGDQYTEKYDLDEFNESVTLRDKITQYTNHYVLYGKELPTIVDETINEWLLVGVEENESEAAIVMQIGYDIQLQDITIL